MVRLHAVRAVSLAFSLRQSVTYSMIRKVFENYFATSDCQRISSHNRSANFFMEKIWCKCAVFMGQGLGVFFNPMEHCSLPKVIFILTYAIFTKWFLFCTVIICVWVELALLITIHKWLLILQVFLIFGLIACKFTSFLWSKYRTYSLG